jgi:ABC-2 type transport system permease protein
VISGPLLRHTWRTHRVRLGIIALSLGVWAFLMPVIYATFGHEMEVMLASGIIPQAFLRLMGADPFSINGSVALGAVHPIAIALEIVYPVGFAAAAIAGERQRGTLEVLLARPLSRRALYATLLLAVIAAAVITTAATTLGTVTGAVLYDVAGGLDAGEMALLGLNTVLLLAALGGISLAASASFDRLTPAIGIALAVTLLGYVLEILGTLWPDAAFLQPYSLFHYLHPLEILGGNASPGDFLVLIGVAAASTAYGLWRFPRRDLAAPT